MKIYNTDNFDNDGIGSTHSVKICPDAATASIEIVEPEVLALESDS